MLTPISVHACPPQFGQPSGESVSKRSTRLNPFLVFPLCPNCPPTFFLPSSSAISSTFFSDRFNRSLDGGFDESLLLLLLTAFRFSISSYICYAHSCWRTITSTSSPTGIFSSASRSYCGGSFIPLL